MAKIRTLPDYLINQIAAGEVVERPFAVVKELVENSIDANSTHISIHIRDGGKKLIQISDNGHGMGKEDIMLAIQRHATSKLPDDKLHLVNSYGFRGEALPSIASVSRMNITSNIKDQEHAWSLDIEGGDISDIMPDNLKIGTKITVRDLFFAVPARLKFLRTARSEITAINDVITRLALANPHISFQLYDDEKLKYHYHAIDDDNNNGKQRITQILGKEFGNNIIAINHKTSDYRISGYIGLPTHNRSNATQQYYFVNQRPVKDKLLIAGLKAAYGDLIPNGRHGVCVLWIDCDGLLVDVNAHPAKTEIRFRDYQQMRQLLIHAVNRTLSETTDNLTAGQQSSGQLANNFMQYAQNYPKATSNQHYDLRESKKSYDYHLKPSAKNMASAQQMQAPISPALLTNNMPPSAGNLASAQSIEHHHHYPLGAALAQIHFNYILAQNDKGLVIIDQHAAHERIVYEHIKTQLSQNGQVKRQILLLPESVNVNKDDGYLLMQQQEKLAKLGLVIEANDQYQNIIITEIPAILGNIAITSLITDMIDCLREYGADDILHDRLFYICATMACHGSIRSGRKLNIDEMNALLREMEACPYSAQCNHGRPAYLEISKAQIEKLFER